VHSSSEKCSGFVGFCTQHCLEAYLRVFMGCGGSDARAFGLQPHSHKCLLCRSSSLRSVAYRLRCWMKLCHPKSLPECCHIHMMWCPKNNCDIYYETHRPLNVKFSINIAVTLPFCVQSDSFQIFINDSSIYILIFYRLSSKYVSHLTDI
jgi:hypothetical protein